jgi:hypothetical protein
MAAQRHPAEPDKEPAYERGADAWIIDTLVGQREIGELRG